MRDQILEILYHNMKGFFGEPEGTRELETDRIVEEHFSGLFDRQIIYPLAALYRLDVPGNPWRGNRALFDSAVRIAEKAFASGELERRALGPFARTYDLLRDELPDPQGWKRELQKLIRNRVIDRIDERERLTVFSSANTGYGTNHLAMELTGLTAYVDVFRDDPDFENMDPGGSGLIARAESWLERFMNYMDEGGYWPECDGPAQVYNSLTAQATMVMAKDLGLIEKYRDRLATAGRYHTYQLFPNLRTTSVTDGRNRAGGMKIRLEACGLFPEGRFVLEQAVANLLEDARNGGRQSPETCNQLQQALDLLPFMCDRSRNIWNDQESWCCPTGQQFSAQKSGPWISAVQNIPYRPRPEGHFNLDYQNLFSLYHSSFGTIFLGSNGKNDPEMSTFNKAFTSFDGGPIPEPMWKFIPGKGRFTATEKGFSLWRDYRGFEGMIDLEAVDANTCRIHLRANTRMSEYPITCSLQPAIALGRGFTDAAGTQHEVTEESFSLSGAELGGAIVLGPEERPNLVSDAPPRPVRIGIPADAELLWPYRSWDTYNLKTHRYEKPGNWITLLKIPVGPDGVELTVETTER